MARVCFLLLGLACLSTATVFDILEHGAVPGNLSASGANKQVLQQLLQAATSGDRVLVPPGSMFYAQGGISVSGLSNVTLDLQGSVVADSNTDSWPMEKPGQYAHFLQFSGCSELTVTGGPEGLLDGNGITWWNKMILGHLNGSRPKLLYIENTTDIPVSYTHLTLPTKRIV
eukprot:TRINITY_DN1576_c0_g1_i2.p1 TRINITY_DN1576_c0_g1~~TRINITY_DN1576_c0_g1_i2.p1  ORF type:complete len:172 (-),score=25.79 TRINITY_DN1576_c0_g1_i2:106-621(-)